MTLAIALARQQCAFMRCQSVVERSDRQASKLLAEYSALQWLTRFCLGQALARRLSMRLFNCCFWQNTELFHGSPGSDKTSGKTALAQALAQRISVRLSIATDQSNTVLFHDRPGSSKTEDHLGLGRRSTHIDLIVQYLLGRILCVFGYGILPSNTLSTSGLGIPVAA
ncbi:hypothetical protein BKA66DRAFT_550870 [Pyrenochaeta sp. MPI-SDFR-AT-0127]|nr:hypothetical protein BKA66DRAFT_550870 [Pyrenochaeta sp. MPI-SDFR-AT-0127]